MPYTYYNSISSAQDELGASTTSSNSRRSSESYYDDDAGFTNQHPAGGEHYYDGPTATQFVRVKRALVAAVLATLILGIGIHWKEGTWNGPTNTSSSSSSSVPNNRDFSLLGMAKAIASQDTSSQDSLDASIQTLSERGRTVKPGRDDILVFQTAAADAYDPEENPEGYLVMIVAENRLMYHELSAKLRQVMTNTTIPEWALDYGQMSGQNDFRKAMAKMMESSWIDAPVSHKDILLQGGAGVVLDNLAWILADEGDAFLINAPTYSNFAGDFEIHGRVAMHVARTQPKNNYEPTLEELEQAYKEAVDAGNTPKIYVICQPNNPVGAIYSHAGMKRMITWALEKGLHVVSDEIYGNSAFPGYHVTSAAQIMNELHPENDDYLTDKVHIVAGLSKDWGMSGFRGGSLFTHNEALKVAMETISYYSSVSEYTQLALTAMLSDEVWRDWYLAENRRRLEETFYAAKEALDLIGVPVFPATGALFLWADFSSYLLHGQTEKELWLELFHDAKVLFAAGESFFEDKPGMFRIVYPWPKGGTVAMKELGRRLVHWKEARET